MTERPNILWICTDQQRFDTIGALHGPHLRTPYLDRLVSEGVTFTHAFCQSPICTPSRASMLTGRYPSTVHGCMNGNDRWSDSAPLATKLLADSGYDCGLVGKLHLAGAQGRIEPRVDDGYRLFEWSHRPIDAWPEGHAYAAWLKDQGHDLAELDDEPEKIPVDLHQSTWCAVRAESFLENELQQPWLITVNPFDPHPPFDAPSPLREKYDPQRLPGPKFRESDLLEQAKLDGVDFQTPPRRPEEFDAKDKIADYYAMVELIDLSVGRLLDALERSGQRDNTIVVFTSDHGEMLGDHGLVLKGCRFYEPLVRVPLIISWPRRFSGGVRSDALVELTDIAPTLLEACGVEVPESMQGRSLLPMLAGSTPLGHHREFVRSEYYRALNPNRPGRENFTSSYATMIRTREHKLVTYHGHEIGELFDLVEDPGEFTNLWEHPNYAEIRFDLMKRSFDALAFAVDVGPEQVVDY